MEVLLVKNLNSLFHFAVNTSIDCVSAHDSQNQTEEISQISPKPLLVFSFTEEEKLMQGDSNISSSLDL